MTTSSSREAVLCRSCHRRQYDQSLECNTGHDGMRLWRDNVHTRTWTSGHEVMFDDCRNLFIFQQYSARLLQLGKLTAANVPNLEVILGLSEVMYLISDGEPCRPSLLNTAPEIYPAAIPSITSSFMQAQSK